MTNEYITKQQVIELVKRCEVIIGCTGAAVLTREIERMADGWISVKDRMPERYENVLSYEPDYGIFDAMWGGDEFYSVGESVPVTHWMPLPKPPKE